MRKAVGATVGSILRQFFVETLIIVLLSGGVGLVAVLSALYPASRAARVDPIEALRYEAGG